MKPRPRTAHCHLLWLSALLLPATASAHLYTCTNVFDQACADNAKAHNTASHLAETVGNAVSDTVEAVGGEINEAAGTIGEAAGSCADAVGGAAGDAAGSCAQAGGEAAGQLLHQGAVGVERLVRPGVDAISGNVQAGMDCLADLAGCAAQVSEDLGLTPEQSQQLTEFAVLKGTITMDASLPAQLTQLRVAAVNKENLSPACTSLLTVSAIGRVAGKLIPLTAGEYSVVVPACGQITYSLVPYNPLYSWTPPKRDVTVGPGQSGSSASTGSGFSAPALQQSGAVASPQQQLLQP